MDYGSLSLKLHRKFRGKLETTSKIPLKDKKDLSTVYTPGVGTVSSFIGKNTQSAFDLTLKGRTVAVVSDGSAILGLGNLGPEAALPVMEGKCLLFKTFAGLDAFPLVLATQDADEIVSIVRGIAPTFAAINLEDISAPRCFEIEERLQDLGIPTMHDDQHATAIVVLAGLKNAVALSGRSWFKTKVIINGAGAAGSAVAKILSCRGFDSKFCSAVADVIVLDSKGIIYRGRPDLDPYKKELAKFTNRNNLRGDLETALTGADVFIGLSKGGILKAYHIKKMSRDPVIFALANPIPEIMPDEAKKLGVRLIATGRSDFPNQINNALVFPGLFKGAITARAKRITPEMKLKAAEALSKLVKKPSQENFIPSIFDQRIVKSVSLAVSSAAGDK
ncbi:malate dehydrogenase [Candidatus Daviesbacteria bacterium RIFCSPLOWO2_01_FULL_41_32]|uniref:Malate dehydrogenase n=1 Tax=Candidatus Daviesbacteria bacterium RIFCSPHIGHO2_01_FULL_41_23 TaxID=1797764 RepID=A0A1F5IRF9_9BACT|nr:MAG: malate dehydrogenase [Candidatus Daviesbacteria bacterium RIFCSPHIGHO2_01_FULL_41_23]OGE62117.1 MAG: malate dehydrogenase [Candidatus Daviesbacteria bacterium RIFCSPLOWO2_01_FULL_41_32]